MFSITGRSLWDFSHPARQNGHDDTTKDTSWLFSRSLHVMTGLGYLLGREKKYETGLVDYRGLGLCSCGAPHPSDPTVCSQLIKMAMLDWWSRHAKPQPPPPRGRFNTHVWELDDLDHSPNPWKHQSMKIGSFKVGPSMVWPIIEVRSSWSFDHPRTDEVMYALRETLRKSMFSNNVMQETITSPSGLSKDSTLSIITSVDSLS